MITSRQFLNGRTGGKRLPRCARFTRDVNYERNAGWRRMAIGRALAALGVIMLVVGAGASSAAQSSSQPSKDKDYAIIFGTVWGAGDRPVAGIPVTIRRSTDKKAKWQLVSDQQGEFAQRVPAGTQDYIVQAEVKTSKGQAKPETTVHIDNDERRDIGLHLTTEAPTQK